ncbi:MAG: hypothetical protein JWN34_2999 [Bryobacterales bacterium]|nr:hypothetical protein [Bryobacterales bacterium]
MPHVRRARDPHGWRRQPDGSSPVPRCRRRRRWRSKTTSSPPSIRSSCSMSRSRPMKKVLPAGKPPRRWISRMAVRRSMRSTFSMTGGREPALRCQGVGGLLLKGNSGEPAAARPDNPAGELDRTGGEKFFQAITRAPVPVDFRTLKALNNPHSLSTFTHGLPQSRYRSENPQASVCAVGGTGPAVRCGLHRTERTSGKRNPLHQQRPERQNRQVPPSNIQADFVAQARKARRSN